MDFDIQGILVSEGLDAAHFAEEATSPDVQQRVMRAAKKLMGDRPGLAYNAARKLLSDEARDQDVAPRPTKTDFAEQGNPESARRIERYVSQLARTKAMHGKTRAQVYTHVRAEVTGR